MEKSNMTQIVPKGVAGSHVAVLGLGLTGKATVKAFLRGKAKMVTVWDDDSAKIASFMKNINNKDKVRAVDLTLSDSWIFDDQRLQYIVTSPGIVPNHKVKVAMKNQMIPVVSDIDLLWESCPKSFYIGVTGSNGKSTVVSLVYQTLKSAGVKSALGGNYGNAALSLPDLGENGVYVLEMSSFQLSLTSKVAFNAAAILNLFNNHDDWHGSKDSYRLAKFRIFSRMNPDDFHVVGTEDDSCLHLAQVFLDAGVKTVPISGNGFFPCGVFWVGGHLYDGTSLDAKKVLSTDDMQQFPGQHNLENIAAAYALLRSYGMDSKDIVKGLKNAKPLPHRMETVAKKGKITFVNDSKATNLAAVSVALQSYKNIFWIAGGRMKGEDFGSLKGFLSGIMKGYFIGEATEDLYSSLKGSINSVKAMSLDKALVAAFEDASASKNDAVILLSPGCSSYDMFENFEERGKIFSQLVNDLISSKNKGESKNT